MKGKPIVVATKEYAVMQALVRLQMLDDITLMIHGDFEPLFSIHEKLSVADIVLPKEHKFSSYRKIVANIFRQNHVSKVVP